MNVQTISGSVLVSGGYSELKGYALKASTDAEIVFRNGDNASGTSYIPLLLGADQSVRDFFNEPIPFNEGLYVHIVSGTVEGTVWVA